MLGLTAARVKKYEADDRCRRANRGRERKITLCDQGLAGYVGNHRIEELLFCDVPGIDENLIHNLNIGVAFGRKLGIVHAELAGIVYERIIDIGVDFDIAVFDCVFAAEFK